MVCTTVH